jgi:hypothetical protein
MDLDLDTGRLYVFLGGLMRIGKITALFAEIEPRCR